MSRLLAKFSRYFCKIVTKQELNKTTEKHIKFDKIYCPSKVPAKPVVATEFAQHCKKTPLSIDPKTIQLLERLSLVDLDSKEALSTLESSIEFADKILQIDTDKIEPLYSVLEDHSLYLRSDKVNEGNCREAILKNGKVVDEDYFVSPPGNIPLEQETKNFTDS